MIGDELTYRVHDDADLTAGLPWSIVGLLRIVGVHDSLLAGIAAEIALAPCSAAPELTGQLGCCSWAALAPDARRDEDDRRASVAPSSPSVAVPSLLGCRIYVDQSPSYTVCIYGENSWRGSGGGLHGLRSVAFFN